VIQTLYRGSVKDLLGPISSPQGNAVVFEYTDAFSVFDWGRMPDFLQKKGEALAVLAADFFEKVEKPEIWKDFSRSPEALALRKANRFGGVFNELGEELQSSGLRTHYLGVLGPSASSTTDITPKKVSDIQSPFRRVMVRQVSVVKPSLATVLGRVLPDYYPTRSSPLPRLIPLEVVFRFSCPEGSSLLDRAAKDPSYLSSLGFNDLKLEPGAKWGFPVLELFTKLETTDRAVSLSEALAISGLSANQLQEVLLKTAWVAGLLKSWCSRLGIELADGKLEWAISSEGRCFLVDAVGPDELRILKNGIQLSKEFLRSYYRETAWFQAISKAKEHAKIQGSTEWKRWVTGNPPSLPMRYRELGMQVYLALANELTGRKWFPEAWSLQRVVSELEGLKKESSP
jgi:phosphoribosylaminoimidazole-succinocarboxamide synthase